VLKDLPGKSEVVLAHGISKLQAKLYKGILTKDLGRFCSKKYDVYIYSTESNYKYSLQISF